MIVTRDFKTFYFNFDFPENADKNLKRQIEFIIKNNEYLADMIIKSKIEQLLLKYRHGNNIHEQVKQQKE